MLGLRAEPRSGPRSTAVELHGAGAGPRRAAPTGSTGHAAGTARIGIAVARHAGAAATGERERRSAFAAADGAGRLRRPDQLDRRRRDGAARLARPTRAAQGPARRQGPDAGLGRARLGAARRRPRHRAGRLPGAAGQRSVELDDLAVRVPRPRTDAATPPTAARPALFDDADDEAERRRPGRCGRRGPASSPTRSRGARRAPARSQLLRDVELPLVRLLAEMERAGIAADREYLCDLESRLRRRGEAGGRGGARRHAARVQPGLAQAAAGDPVRPAQPAEDEEDQDRLHHRRRRAGLAGRPRPTTRCRSSCCATAT